MISKGKLLFFFILFTLLVGAAFIAAMRTAFQMSAQSPSSSQQAYSQVKSAR